MQDFFKAVEIEINHHCNLSCSYCPNSVAKRVETGIMPLSLYATIMQQLAERNFSGRISYDFYNEPLLHPKLNEIVKLTKKYLPSCFLDIYSNGSYLTYEKLDQLLSAGTDQFTITKHEGVAHLPLDQYWNQLPSSYQTKIKYRNYGQLKLTNRGGTVPHVGHQFSTTLLPCYIPSTVVSITVEGNVLACYEDFFEQHIMGNVKTQSLWQIWNSDAYTEFRQQLRLAQRHKYNPCNSCNRLNTVALTNP